jgi:DNA-binding transcriptional LysR family regulator
MSLPRNSSLPPLDYFLAFESAADCGSFASASKDLNISETAISRKVKLLEQHYDSQLFDRGHRSIHLTETGRAFLDRIRPGLQTLRSASIEMLKEQDRKPVTLAATNSVASLWLTSRLPKFNTITPDVSIMLVASDNDEECLAENVDLAILRGDGNWPGFNAQLLFGETIFPVCSPEYLAANPDVTDISQLFRHSLIGVVSRHTEWMNWRTWLSFHEQKQSPRDQTILFNNYALSIGAATQGLGVALGWNHLVDPLLEAGTLVRPLADTIDVRTESGYYLLRPVSGTTAPECETVAKWLIDESSQRKRYSDRQDDGEITPKTT